jgi:hypothetical protein
MKISNHDLWILLQAIENAQDFRSERSPEQKMECLTDALEEVADILLKMNGKTRKTVNLLRK